VIANCGAMHLNWERLSLSGYLEALEAHNEAHQDLNAASDRPSNPDRLRRFVDAHRGNA